jgi:predicted DNA binding protein
VPGTSDIRTYVELFEEQYEDVELVGRRELDEPLTVRSAVEEEYRSRLTERQEEILRTAYATGFFESPRETTAQELADLLGISQPTASGHIREGERKLFDLLFDEE